MTALLANWWAAWGLGAHPFTVFACAGITTIETHPAVSLSASLDRTVSVSARPFTLDTAASIASVSRGSFLSVGACLRWRALGWFTCPSAVRAHTGLAGNFIVTRFALHAFVHAAGIFAVPLTACALASLTLAHQFLTRLAFGNAVIRATIPLSVLANAFITPIVGHPLVAFLALANIAAVTMTQPFIVLTCTRLATRFIQAYVAVFACKVEVARLKTPIAATEACAEG